ncbi:hypothetical protein BAOM_1407 [Peribacillus asahii]|uniref:Uncharacterized protein n=1 Tax=Peribacillus asahii TaxID=228899 RepID=A0A3Q9RHY3_9BACI|nr:hypothetical protein [Peribacillus asahii]AZV42017.1 hypothetical protein BAOM_1407 [Peribacillus asahii]
MTKERIEELAMEVVTEALPDLESNNQSYFYGIVKKLSNTIIDDYALDVLRTEEHVKALMRIDLEELQKSL